MITIYGKNNCVFCDKAKALAKQHQLEHEYKNIEYNNFFSELTERADFQVKSVPQIWWGDKYIGGYDKFAEEVSNTFSGFGEGAL